MMEPVSETAEARLARLNPPGQRQLRFRAGTYGTFLRRMLARLPRAEVHVDGGAATRPLAALDAGSSGDFAAALLDAWATVGDVLTFYQERILNEGFLRTALEARSIRELTSQLGFPLQPGLAARTWLAFGVSAAPGARTAVEVPAGTAAQSIPGTGETAQTFETSATLRALPAWNALRAAPAFTTVAPRLVVGGAQARLAGTGTGLTVGAPVLAAAADGAAWTFGTVTAVEAAPRTGETRVAWTVAERGTRGTGAMAEPQAWAFARTARLFGYDADAWDSLTTEQKRAHREILGGVFVLGEPGEEWSGASGGLPAADVRVLAVDAGGRLYAGTVGQGLYASADGGRTWSAGGPRYADVHALAAAGDGIVYAGLAAGRVYRSSDGGATWDAVSGATVAAPAAKVEGVAVTSARLPAAPVRALYAAEDGTLYAGTPFGVYRAEGAAPAWTPVPFHASAHSPAETGEEEDRAAKGHGVAPAVWCFARAPWGELVAGTDAG
ncbi:MAG TPA: hypothetical protein VFT45_18080, partial [Longimicrobium sp.]|nr:hypothetical protein [Longimicrobium sp.]